MSFYSNSDLKMRFGFSEDVLYDLVAHKRIPFFPYAKVKKRGGNTYGFNIYTEQTIRQLMFLLSQHEGSDNDSRARKLMTWATENYTSIKKEDMDTFFNRQSDIIELSRKVDSILHALKIGKVEEAVETALNVETPYSKPKGWTDRSLEATVNATVHASTPIKSLVHDAVEIIVEGLHRIPGSTFKKADVIALVDIERPVLANRMRKHKDVVWDHARKFLKDNNYIAQGPTLDTLTLGGMYTGAYTDHEVTETVLHA